MTTADAAHQPWSLPPGRGSRNESTRRHNLSTVLRAVHYAGAISRADLTRQTGLNRSTIGTMVAALADAGLVTTDSSDGSLGVGRPSPIVTPTRTRVVLAIHPDIDAIRVAAVALGGAVIESEERRLDAVPDVAHSVAIIGELADAVLRRLPDDVVILGAGAAVPGLVSHERGVVVDAPHLGWVEAPLARDLEQVLDLPVDVGNDATLGLLAEAHFGAARGMSDVVYLNGSASGIGGSAMVGDRLLTGARGFGGEFGHMVVTEHGAPCDCGRRGCLETEVNVRRLGSAGKFRASELDREAVVLARAIGNLVSAFNPELVLLGGFLGEIVDARGDELRAAVEKESFGALATGVRVTSTELGDDLLIVGAAELAFTALLSDPLGAPQQIRHA